MKKTPFLLMFLIFCAAPVFAQTSELGILFGGSKRFFSNSDKKLRTGLPESWDIGNSVREVWYGYYLDHDTVLKIKAGEITGPVGAVVAPDPADPAATDLRDGRIEHLDLLVDYRFDEPFGSTGLFAGAGLYRQRSGTTATTPNEGTDYGFSVGVNGDFPLSRRYGVIIEGTYHWVNYSYKPRFLTVTGGLRIKL